MLACLHWNWW